MVQKARPRPALAPYARSVPGARVGAHAAADAGIARRRLLRAISRALPYARPRRRGTPAERAEVVGRPRVLRASPEPSRARSPCHTRRGTNSARPGATSRASGDRCVHRGRGGIVRVRAPRGAGRHERRASSTARVPAGRRPEVLSRPARDVGARRAASPSNRPTHLDAQPGPHGARRPDLHGAR